MVNQSVEVDARRSQAVSLDGGSLGEDRRKVAAADRAAGRAAEVRAGDGGDRRHEVDQRRESVGLGGLREQEGVRDDKGDVDRLLVGVERLLAQSTMRKAHL